MQTPGLTNTPLTKTLLIYTITTSVLLTLLDAKHLASLRPSLHFHQYAQFSRALTWHPAGFANSTETLFAALLLYHLRPVERAWGTRKLASFLLSTLPYTTLLPPLLLWLVLGPVSGWSLDYLPSGPVGAVFALLAQYFVVVPGVYRVRLGTGLSVSGSGGGGGGSGNGSGTSASGSGSDASRSQSQSQNQNQNNNPTQSQSAKKSITLVLSDKSTTYLVAAQLALSQFPAMLLPAAVGWVVGLAWRADLLPFVSSAWRVPGWVVGERGRERRGLAAAGGGGGAGGEGEGGYYEDLRRRLEGEAVAAAASGSDQVGVGSGSGSGRQRRTGGL